MVNSLTMSLVCEYIPLVDESSAHLAELARFNFLRGMACCEFFLEESLVQRFYLVSEASVFFSDPLKLL